MAPRRGVADRAGAPRAGGDPGRRARGAELELRLPDVRALMAERLAGRPTRANFRTGTLTVCTMVPMRSVPHRVVCLLGLDDGVFPRAGAVDGDDVLARDPLTGERDPRSEDRQLLLDARPRRHRAPRGHLHRRQRDDRSARPPAVPLGELLDALDATAPGGRDHALRRHPLQAFDPRNLRAEAAPFSFDAAALAGARAAAARPRRPRVPGRRSRCRPRRRRRARRRWSAFLRTRSGRSCAGALEIALPDEGDEVADGLPVELDGLQQWGVGDRLLRDLLGGRTPRAGARQEWRRGVLPPGRLGWQLAQRIARRGRAGGRAWPGGHPGSATARRVDVDVDLGGGRRLAAPSPTSTATASSSATYSRLGPKHQLDAWVPLLALCAARPGPAVDRGRDRPGSVRGRARRRAPPSPPVDDAGRRCCATSSRSTTPACASRCRCRSRPATPGPEPTPRRRSLRRPRRSWSQGPVRPGERGRGPRPGLGARRPARRRCSSSGRAPGEELDGADHAARRARLPALGAVLERAPVDERPHRRRCDAVRPARPAAAPAPPCSRPAPAPARPTPSARWSPATSPRAWPTLDELLVITFGRAASQELRERVREQLVEAERALADPAAAPSARRPARLLAGGGRRRGRARRRRRLRDALADFDGATIATTHQFCQLVLRSLGVAGDTDAGAELVEDLDDLVVEVVDDLYLRRFGDAAGTPPFDRDGGARARPGGGRRPAGPCWRRPTPSPGTPARRASRFAARGARRGRPAQAAPAASCPTTTCSAGSPTR